MDLDRGTLARIDRKVLAGLEYDESYHMVRVSVSEATWSTWKRYCDAAGVSMGRAIVALVENELRSVVGELDAQPLFLEPGSRTALPSASGFSMRESTSWRPGATTSSTGASEYRRSYRPQVVALTLKVGRNDPCPCGSGLKYKRCHGPWSES